MYRHLNCCRHLKIQYVIAIHLMRLVTNFYDFRFKWTATTGTGMHPTKTWSSQLVNFKNAIWTWGHFRRTIKLCFKLGKNSTETYGMLQTAFRPSRINQASVFEWYKRFKEGRESVRDDERCGRNKEVNTPELIGQRVEVLREFRKTFRRKSPALFKWAQWHFQQVNAPAHNSILITDYLTKMVIKTVPHPPYSPDLAPCDFWLFPKLRGRRYETIEEMKEALTKVIEGHTRGLPWGLPEVIGTVQSVRCSRRRLLPRGLEFHVCTINKSAHTKKVWKLI